jgi:hypothetical protein
VLVNNAAVCFNDPTLYGKVPHTPFAQQAGVTLDTNFFGTLAGAPCSIQAHPGFAQLPPRAAFDAVNVSSAISTAGV